MKPSLSGFEVESWSRRVQVVEWSRHIDIEERQDYVQLCKWIPEGDCSAASQDDKQVWDRNRLDGSTSRQIEGGKKMRYGKTVVYEWGWPL